MERSDSLTMAMFWMNMLRWGLPKSFALDLKQLLHIIINFPPVKWRTCYCPEWLFSGYTLNERPCQRLLRVLNRSNSFKLFCGQIKYFQSPRLGGEEGNRCSIAKWGNQNIWMRGWCTKNTKIVIADLRVLSMQQPFFDNKNYKLFIVLACISCA